MGNTNRFISPVQVVYVAISTIIACCLFLIIHPNTAAAATITVNSNADTTTDTGECTLREAITAANSDTASGATGGECGAGSGTDTINFTLTGTADYTLGVAPGYAITLSQKLPDITTSLTINGYSQTQSVANSAISPNPFNGKILVEIDGSGIPGAGGGYECFKVTSANGVTIKGLLINSCGGDGVRLYNTTNTTIQGNYIGVGYNDTTDLATVSKPNGGVLTDAAHGNGIYIENTTYTQIGGTNPQDRNVISGNQFSEILIDAPNYVGSDKNDPTESNHTTIQGNYFGLAADGLTAKPCGYDYGHGNALLITHSSDDTIGGSTAGARNVIASSKEYGISFRNGSNSSVVEGNYIGTDYTGLATVSHSLGTGHPEAGISIATVSNGGYNLGSWNIRIGGANSAQGNVISGNSYNGGANGGRGVFIHDTVEDNTIQNNLIGLGSDGESALGNQYKGISIDRATGTLIDQNKISNNPNGIDIGTQTQDVTITSNIITSSSNAGVILNAVNDYIIGKPNEGNIIYDSGVANIFVQGLSLAGAGSTNGKIQGNSIGIDNWQAVSNPPVLGGAGIFISGDPSNILVGGSGEGEGNVIAGSESFGIGVAGIQVNALPLTLSPSDITMLNNEIVGIEATNPALSITSGLGIDLFLGVDESPSPDGIPDSFANLGLNTNSVGGTDAGKPNDYLNHPVITSLTQNGLTANVELDAILAGADTDQYQIEFFANDDGSDGQAQTYLGAITVSAGAAQSQSFTLPNSTNLTGKYISATATQINGGALNDGFGATSELSEPILATVASLPGNNSGNNQSDSDSQQSGDLSNTGSGYYPVIGLLLGLILIAEALKLRKVAGRSRSYKL